MAKAAGLVCALLLLASFCCQSLAQSARLPPRAELAGAVGMPAKCCFKFQTGKLQKGNIVGWYLTSPECSHPAVVFKTRVGKEICANPRKPWVRKYQGFFQPNSLSVSS